MEKAKEKIIELSKNENNNNANNVSNSENISSQRQNMNTNNVNTNKIPKTIEPGRLLNYFERYLNSEALPPPIILIDIRDDSKYHHSHISWKSLYPNLKCGVLNIPINYFFGSSINTFSDSVTKREENRYGMELFNNLNRAGLVVYYDDQTVNVNPTFQVIEDILFNIKSDRKTIRPPVLLSGGFNGWLNYLNQSKRNIEDWVQTGYGNGYITINHDMNNNNKMDMVNNNIIINYFFIN